MTRAAQQWGDNMSNDQRLAAGALVLALTIFAGGANGAETADTARPSAVSCILIKTAAQLNAVRNNLGASYCLANDIDLSSIANFVPIGTSGTPFTGNFFGNDHAISNLKINSALPYVGLFGGSNGAVIRDVSLVNVNIRSTSDFASAGGLAGFVNSTAAITTDRVHVSGTIRCTGNACEVGGIAGTTGGSLTLARSSSSANVTGAIAGGLIGFYNGTITDSFATGTVICTGACQAGGLAALGNGKIIRSFATGSVSGGDGSVVGGLVGLSTASTTASFATGAVTGGAAAIVGGLIGRALNGTNVNDQCFAVGPISGGAGATTGGLIASVSSATTTNSYWDTSTTGVATTAGGGTGKTTTQLRAALPAGFNTSTWAISSVLSYPFLNSPDLDFASPLATLVISNKIFTFVPISQLDLSQYIGVVHHADAASLAAVYTMIARGVGIADNVAQLKAVKINKYYWHDATQMTTFSGPLTLHATLSALAPLPGAISGQNVIAHMKVGRLAILRGTYTKAGGGTATHYMLATMFTKKPNGLPSTVIANDPYTGWQVEIDPATKTVVSPSNFPLAGFKVNAYQAVTVN